MRVLSLSRPWPWTIFDLIEDPKTIENRCWMPPIEVIGEQIAFHAAKSWDDSAISFLHKLGIENCPARFDLHPHGVIAGVVTLERIVTTARTLRPRDARWFFETRDDGKQNYGWVLSDAIKLAEPIPLRGAQGLRHLPADVEALVRAQLDGAIPAVAAMS